VPTTALIEQWKKEIAKFYGEEILQSKWIDIQCVQTAYKNKRYVDLMVIDEIHTTLSAKYSNLYLNVSCSQRLGLTATTPKHDYQLEVLNKYAPVVYEKLLHDISEQKIVSDYIIYNVETPMTKSDAAKYRLFDTKLKRAQLEIGVLKYRDPNLKDLAIFDIAKTYSTQKSKEPIVIYSKQFWSSMTLRKWVCYESEAKIKAVQKILSRLPNKK